MWMDVDGCGWMWMDVDGCGWMWMDVDGERTYCEREMTEKETLKGGLRC
jgi:hypothetical protein